MQAPEVSESAFFYIRQLSILVSLQITLSFNHLFDIHAFLFYNYKIASRPDSCGDRKIREESPSFTEQDNG